MPTERWRNYTGWIQAWLSEATFVRFPVRPSLLSFSLLFFPSSFLSFYFARHEQAELPPFVICPPRDKRRIRVRSRGSRWYTTHMCIRNTYWETLGVIKVYQPTSSTERKRGENISPPILSAYRRSSHRLLLFHLLPVAPRLRQSRREVGTPAARDTPPSRKNSPTPYFFQLEHLWAKPFQFGSSSVWIVMTDNDPSINLTKPNQICFSNGKWNFGTHMW